MNKLSQLKNSPLTVLKTNLLKCGDTILVTFFIGVVFFGVEVLARRCGLDSRYVTPFSNVIKGQLDILSIAVFYAVVVFYAGLHLILSNVGFIQPVLRFLGVETKMDVFYLFVLQCVASAIGIRTGMLGVNAFISPTPLAGAGNIGLLFCAAVVLVGVWYAKGVNGKTWAFPAGVTMIAAAGLLYCSVAFFC